MVCFCKWWSDVKLKIAGSSPYGVVQKRCQAQQQNYNAQNSPKRINRNQQNFYFKNIKTRYTFRTAKAITYLIYYIYGSYGLPS